jgi:hypothetical protein
MNQSKNWYESKTIWGVIIACIGWAASQYFGVPVGVESTDPIVAETLSNIAQIVGLALAVFGRVTATQRIKQD